MPIIQISIELSNDMEENTVNGLIEHIRELVTSKAPDAKFQVS